MKKILIDLTYILDEQDLKKSTSIYIQRFLDNLDLKDCKRNSYIFLVRKSLLKFFSEKYAYLSSDFIAFWDVHHIGISFIKSILESMRWRKQVNSIDCDVVYVPFVWIYNSRKINKRKVSTIHDLKPIRDVSSSYLYKPYIFRMFVLKAFKYYFRKAVKTSDKIIAISSFVKKDIENTFKCHGKISVVYNGIPIDTSCTEIAKLKHRHFVLYVNTLASYKNALTLIRAFKLLDTDNLFLVLVGKETEYWKEACLPEITENIIRFNYVTDSELVWLYQNAELFVTPSLHEGFGFTPVEAAMHCCPVVSSRADALPEVTMGAAYYYEPADDYQALFEKIKEVLQDKDENPKLFNEKMKTISKNFKERYSLLSFTKNILKLLEE